MYILSAVCAFSLEKTCLCESFPVGSKCPIIYNHLTNALYCHILKAYSHKILSAFTE